MTMHARSQKALTTNPLKSSAPLGAAMAFLGVAGAIPLFHGSQGCTSFALVSMVRHFKEPIPLQTTAMNEVSTILGGADHVEEALLNLKARVKPTLIGLCTTALVETRGEDFAGDLRLIREKRAAELDGTEIVFASTPDFRGAVEEGWASAVTAMIESLVVEDERLPSGKRVNVLAGSHLTAGDIEALRDLIESFGLEPTILPDVSGALDGTVPDRWIATSYGGTQVEDIRRMGGARATLAIGLHMRGPARALETRTGVPFQLFEDLHTLDSIDRFVVALAQLSGRPVPKRIQRKRSQAVDAMLDCHFHVGGKRVAVAADPDLLLATARLLADMGADVAVAVSSTDASPALDLIPAEVVVGDLGDMEHLARVAGVDLIATHAHGRQAAERLGLPHERIGFPVFDRLGAAHRRSIGYEGLRDSVFSLANQFLARLHAPTPEDLAPRHLFPTETADDRFASLEAYC